MKADLVKGAKMIYELFKLFGLKMHIGRDGAGKSKTEERYFPRASKRSSMPQQATYCLRNCIL
jgi:hypothetical protein